MLGARFSVFYTKSLLEKRLLLTAYSYILHIKRGKLKIYIYTPLVIFGALKQEVDTEEEETALFDNTKWCKDTTTYETCIMHVLIPITYVEKGKKNECKNRASTFILLYSLKTL